MKCEFDYCIYNKEYACILDEIQIDALGICASCEIVVIQKEIVEKYKKARLDEIKEIWESNNKQFRF